MPLWQTCRGCCVVFRLTKNPNKPSQLRSHPWLRRCMRKIVSPAPSFCLCTPEVVAIAVLPCVVHGTGKCTHASSAGGCGVCDALCPGVMFCSYLVCEVMNQQAPAGEKGTYVHMGLTYRMLQSLASSINVATATWQVVLAMWLLDAALDEDSSSWACAWAVQLLVGRDVTFGDPTLVACALRRLLECGASTLAVSYLDHAHLSLMRDPRNLVRCCSDTTPCYMRPRWPAVWWVL